MTVACRDDRWKPPPQMIESCPKVDHYGPSSWTRACDRLAVIKLGPPSCGPAIFDGGHLDCAAGRRRHEDVVNCALEAVAVVLCERDSMYLLDKESQVQLRVAFIGSHGTLTLPPGPPKALPPRADRDKK